MEPAHEWTGIANETHAATPAPAAPPRSTR